MKLLLLLLSLCSINTYAQVIKKSPAQVERWMNYEIKLAGPSSGNPFEDVWLTAVFSNGAKKVKVNGFYDGGGSYIVRFMPQEVGTWTYTTQSNIKALHGKKGTFVCSNASALNHGPVQVEGIYNFKYADGKRYYPFGTTLYAWTHQGEGLQEETLNTLRNAPFNKVRMCVFPKFYGHNILQEPPLFPYKSTSTKTRKDGTVTFNWDFKQFEPAFFQHLEKRIKELDEAGIEADLIIFHPYDKGRWGFDSLGKENDIKYIKYLVARLASYKNIWWSMANEFDYIRTKPREDWADYTNAVVDNDPFGHLCSIHNGSVYYDNWNPKFTHASIQNGSVVEDFGRAITLRDAYMKPIVYDEVCYEGNLSSRWGRLTGEQMTEAFWQGIIAGTYVTHGETYNNAGDTIFWARGGKLIGTSPARIKFLRDLLEQGPGPLELADPWKDNRTSYNDSNYYIIYFGREMQADWVFNLPKKGAANKGAKYKVDIIDSWEMTVTPVKETFELGEAVDYRIYDKERKKIRLPNRPYLALRLTRI